MKHMEYIKLNHSISDSNLPGSNYVYENYNLHGPKILLAQGWSKLSELVESLKNQNPIKPLEYNYKLCLEVPNSKSDWSNKEIFLKLISDKKEELNLKKTSFHFDIGYLDAETSAVLQLIDDNTGFSGSRRRNILNPNCTRVGISNIINGLKNCTYVLFVRSESNHEESTAITNTIS